jgi:hypothetical protein
VPLPSRVVYNDLSGDEVRHILEERFSRLLSDVPYLQKHLTLPRVKMTVTVHLDVYADQPNPERHTIQNSIDVVSDDASVFAEPVFSGDATDSVSAAPGPGGKPPDQIRDEHGLGISVPTRGSLNHTALEDRVEGRKMSLPNGATVDRTGSDPIRPGATVVVQDFGRAGLAEGQFNRSEVSRRAKDGPVAPPVFGREDR